MVKSCGVRVRFIRTDSKLKSFLGLASLNIAQLYSPECAYCIEEAPHYVRATFEYCSIGNFARVDVSELDDATLEDLKVEGIPLILAFRDGNEIGRKDGYANFEEIAEFLEAL